MSLKYKTIKHWNPAKRSMDFWVGLSDKGMQAHLEWLRMYNKLDENVQDELFVKISMLQKMIEHFIPKVAPINQDAQPETINVENLEASYELLKQIQQAKINACLTSSETPQESSPQLSQLPSPGESLQQG